MADAHGQASLRVEHDALARRLETRPSVDVARNGFVLVFLGLVAAGICWALLRDRYDPVSSSDLGRAHPVVVVTGSAIAALVGAALIARGAVALRRSRRMAREEAVLFARLRELRRLLEIDA